MEYFGKGAEEALIHGASGFALNCLTSAGGALAMMDSISDSTHTEVSLHHCKIEFLIGLVMIERSDWFSALEHFQGAVEIYEAIPKMPLLTTLRRRLSFRSSVVPAIQGEVQSIVGVAKTLIKKIIKSEKDRGKLNNVIRLKALKCITGRKNYTEDAFDAFTSTTNSGSRRHISSIQSQLSRLDI